MLISTPTDLPREFAFCVCILVLKMFFLTFFTAVKRFQHKSFANAEDRGRRNVRTNENVERVRRCHQNDLENIPIFFAVGFLFLQLNPPASAVYYFYAFTAARVIHTLSYLAGLQPWRFLSFVTGVLATVGMVVQIMMVCLGYSL